MRELIIIACLVLGVCVARGQKYPALSLDGTGDSFAAADSANLDLGTNPFTICAWIKTSTSIGVVFDKYDAGAGQYNMQITASGVIRGFTYNAGFGVDVSGTTDLRDGAWHHVAFVVNFPDPDGDAFVYVDGIEEGNDFIGINKDTDGNTALLIGTDTIANDFNGDLDDLRIYSRGLKTAEIAKLANMNRHGLAAGGGIPYDPKFGDAWGGTNTGSLVFGPLRNPHTPGSTISTGVVDRVSGSQLAVNGNPTADGNSPLSGQKINSGGSFTP